MNTPDHPLLIVQTGEPPRPVAERHGGFACMVREATGLPETAVRVVAVHEGESLEEPARYGAAIITGSPAMVTDRADWSERTAEWIRQAVRASLPMLGICYGHQLLSHALGGKVGYLPRGRAAGTRTVELLETAGSVPILAGLPSNFPANLLHQQSVLELPPGAVVLARSEHDPHHVVQYAEHVFSTQYHPEFDEAVMASYLECFRPGLGQCGFNVDALLQEVQATPASQQLLQRFVARYVVRREAA